MSIISFVRGVIGAEEPTTYVEGTIVDGPSTVDGDGKTSHTIAFRLDTVPDIQFQQALSALAPKRQRGDRVRVHYRMKETIGAVDWVEKI